MLSFWSVALTQIVVRLSGALFIIIVAICQGFWPSFFVKVICRFVSVWPLGVDILWVAAHMTYSSVSRSWRVSRWFSCWRKLWTTWLSSMVLLMSLVSLTLLLTTISMLRMLLSFLDMFSQLGLSAGDAHCQWEVGNGMVLVVTNDDCCWVFVFFFLPCCQNPRPLLFSGHARPERYFTQ